MSPAPIARSTPSHHRETAFVAAMTVVGLVLRIWGLRRLGLVHFDEGVYAIAGYLTLPLGELDPTAIPYAPPGFPLLIGLFYLVIGPSDVSAILVSILLGTLTVPVSAWLARRTFGPGAGATASALAALSGFHVAFSRMALTDATFSLAWLLGLIAGQRFLERPGLATAVALGLATGTAQLVKYSGWTVGLAVILTAAAITVLDPSRRTIAHQRRVWGWGVPAAVVAAVMYAPWYRYVEAHGGYAGLMAHHRSYLGTPATWLPHWVAQMEQASVLSGGFAWNLAAIAAVVAGVLIGGAGGRPSRWGLAVLVALAAAAVVAPTTLWWIGLTLAAFAWRDASPGLRLLAVAWGGLSILTPFYHPYARLWLPIQTLGWLVAAGIVRDLLSPAETRRWRSWWVVGCCGAAVAQSLLMGTTFGLGGGRPTLMAPSDSLRKATAQALADLPQKKPELRLLTRPPVDFYLGGRVAMMDVPRVEDLFHRTDGAWALVDVALLRQSDDVDGLVARLLQSWERVGEYPTSLDLPTLLDVDPGAAVFMRPGAADAPLWLLRPRPGAPR